MKYAKLFSMVVATVLTALVASWTDGVSAQEWINVSIAGVTAASVFAGPNIPGSKYTKTVLAVLGAALAFLTTAILGGIDSAELLQLSVLVFGALGVYAVPNKDAGVNISNYGDLGR